MKEMKVIGNIIYYKGWKIGLYADCQYSFAAETCYSNFGECIDHNNLEQAIEYIDEQEAKSETD